MTLFGRKKKIDKEKKDEVVISIPDVKTSEPKKSGEPFRSTSWTSSINELILLNPRITEKATEAQDRGVYVFDVEKRSTKTEVTKAVESVYKVKPRKVNFVKTRGRDVMGKKGTKGKTASGKKAYVYLKKGDSIEIV